MNPLTACRQLAVFYLQLTAGACDFLADLIEDKVKFDVTYADWEFDVSQR